MRASIARWVLPLMFATALAGCAAQAPAPAAAPPVDNAAITADIGKMEEMFATATAARDTVGIMNYYADDAHVLPPNTPRVDGHDAVLKAWKAFFQIPGLELTVKSNDVIVSKAGDMAVDVGSYHMKSTGPKGKTIEDVGKYVTVFKKTDTGWKAVVDTYNSDMAMPGQK